MRNPVTSLCHEEMESERKQMERMREVVGSMVAPSVEDMVEVSTL